MTQGHDAPQTNDVYEVTRDSARGVLVDSVESSLISVKIRDANNYNDQTRFILQQCINLMPLRDRIILDTQLDEVELIEDELDKTRSRFRRFLLVMKYQRVSKKTFLMAKKASNRLINDQIRGRSRAASGPQGPPPSNQGSSTAPAFPTPMPTGVQPSIGSSGPPFTSRGRGPLQDVALNNVDRVEVTTLQSRTTGDPLVLMEMYEMNQPRQQFVATFQPFLSEGNMSDAGTVTRLLGTDPAETGSIHTISETLGPFSDEGVCN